MLLQVVKQQQEGCVPRPPAWLRLWAHPRGLWTGWALPPCPAGAPGAAGLTYCHQTGLAFHAALLELGHCWHQASSAAWQPELGAAGSRTGRPKLTLSGFWSSDFLFLLFLLSIFFVCVLTPNSSVLLKKEITNGFWSAVFQWEVRIISLKKKNLPYVIRT